MKDGMIECSVCHSKLVSPNTKAVSKAYDKYRSKISSKQRALNILLVVGDCILVGLQPILVFMSKVDGSFKFSPISVNFLTEAAKLLFAIVMLLLQARRQKVGEKPLLSVSSFVQAARNNVLLAVPALLYAINNYLKFTMQLYFNPATVKMLSNLKNLFLYGYGAIFNFLGILVTAIVKGPNSFDILQGHSKATMLLIFNNAAQGILSSFFFKYADTILKKYSSTVATIFTGIASAALFGHTLTINFLLGISVVFISMHQFFSPLSKVKDEQQNGVLELKNVQDNHRSSDSSFINMAAGANEEASHHVGSDERQPLLPI
ncbi:CMP-sialic acid transporter like [Actinidia chinensis var. chinensis]|uniref:CMP-sialic acid transporter like n=1 Tax=Actinidia chinensis var. chinensis TaxID=1590841 RepID=A0A2R6S0T2_ACTCC|nr:CMP-sialic acid transporter like [Actinidia chinensis var. chinensis]